MLRHLLVLTTAFTATSVLPVAVHAEASAPAPIATDDLRCMTQAIYYEAAREPADGRAAVAAVVLARLAHPAYPTSVCGVVFQGSMRATGCQFSFTCDGALARAPEPRLWREAEAIAVQALDGSAPARAFVATHYHARYVRPVWASSLTEVARIGQHIFYALGRTRTPPITAGIATAGPTSAIFSPWGLKLATLTPSAGGIAVTSSR